MKNTLSQVVDFSFKPTNQKLIVLFRAGMWQPGGMPVMPNGVPVGMPMPTGMPIDMYAIPGMSPMPMIDMYGAPIPGMPMTGMIMPGAPYPTQMPVVVPAAAPAEEERGKLVPTTADATYNLNRILAGTITSSDYFLSLLSEYDTFEKVMDVIRDECTHLEAFEPGKANLPSVAFWSPHCTSHRHTHTHTHTHSCMYKLFMLKLDVPQMNFMLRYLTPY